MSNDERRELKQKGEWAQTAGAILPDSQNAHEPDLKDAAVGPRQSDLDSAN